MTTAVDISHAARWMTTEELLALPEHGIDRELVRGQLREREITRCNPMHSAVEANVARILGNWSVACPEPRGRVLSGEAGFCIRRDPDTTVGIDVAYIDAATSARIPKNAALIDAPPVLAVEILSPSDKQEEILANVQDYLESGVMLVLLLEPVFETVTVYRPDAPPTLLSGTQELSADNHLPGFRCAEREFFHA